ncbi:hypothetical protein ACQ4LE_005270 [Meloidogyne hapla]|uniref:FGFR1 oncogene partner 2 homolog n=1 Tax=Meloidogyne hapla TaxID=6305 RepID=A0A1I8B6I0_MELHA
MRMSQLSNNSMDQLLAEMCKHVSSLQDKLQVANSAVNKAQLITEGITQAKEYQEKVASLNSCWRTKNRSQLVCNLQQENRQIIALEEENRQLKLALKEMEDGMHLIMGDYRRVLSGFMRVETLDEAVCSKTCNTYFAGVDHKDHIGMARAAGKYLAVSEQTMAGDKAMILQLESENTILRNILNDIPIYQTAMTPTKELDNKDLKASKEVDLNTPTKEVKE